MQKFFWVLTISKSFSINPTMKLLALTIAGTKKNCSEYMPKKPMFQLVRADADNMVF